MMSHKKSVIKLLRKELTVVNRYTYYCSRHKKYIIYTVTEIVNDKFYYIKYDNGRIGLVTFGSFVNLNSLSIV